jgi:hypothetical protein
MVHRVRVILIVSGALALAGCESAPDSMKVNNDAFKSQANLDSVRFESEPPGAEAKTSNGQSCRTPCALALPVNAPLTVTFTLNGYQPETERLEPITETVGFTIADASSPTQLRPNPVYTELTPAPPSKPVKKIPPKKKPAAKQAAKQPAKPAPARSRPATATGSAPAPMSAEPSQMAPAPWPSTSPQR